MFVSQNIIKKVNGQKFVYRFVSYPDILKGDVTSRAEGDVAPQAKKGESPVLEGESADHSKVGGGSSTKQSSRNDYIHSGLYTSFTLNSLQNGRQLFKSIKIENPAEKMADRRNSGAPAQGQEQPSHTQQPTLSSVIKFVNTPTKPAPAQTPAPPPQVDAQPPLLPNPLDPLPAAAQRHEGLGSHSSLPSQPVYPFDPVHQSEAAFGLQDLTSANASPNLVLYSSQEMAIDSDMESQPSDPQAQDKVSMAAYVSAGPRPSSSVQSQFLSRVSQVDSSIALSDETSLVDAETSSSSVSSSTTVSTQSSGKTRKPPKVLQISPPTLLVTTSDFSPMSLCSPSLPTASLTPAMIPVSVQKMCAEKQHNHLKEKRWETSR